MASNDILARLIGQWLSERLGQPFVVENRPGAGGNIGTECSRACASRRLHASRGPDRNAINTTLYDKLNFNFIRDIAPVAGIFRGSYVVVVNPSVPAKTIPEFIAYAKSNPGKINMASAGTGTGPHVAGELFNIMSGANMVHVPYRGGGPALNDLLGGQVQVYFAISAAAIGYISAGKLRALAVTTATRSELLPDIPTIGEFLPGYEASAWLGLGAPRDTPTEIVEKLNKEINAALADPKLKARLADLGGTVLAAPAGRLRQAHRRRNREVGQGDPGGKHQGGMKRRFTGNSERDVYETSPPTISASGRGRCRAAGRVARSLGRKPIRRGRCASSLALPPAARPTSSRA